MKRANCIFWLLLITFFSAAKSYDVFEENGKVGLKNEQGKVIIPAHYEALGWSNHQFSVLNNVTGYKVNGLWGLISLDNQAITKASYEEVLPAEGSLIIARKQSGTSLRSLAGCLNTSGKEVLPFQYDGIKIYFLRAIVYTKIGIQFRYGLINLENKMLVPQEYKNIYSIGSLRYAVENFENKMALFTENGEQVTSFTIDSISSFKKNYAITYQGLQQGLLDREGQIKMNPTYREIRIDDDGSVHARQTDEWIFVNGQNKHLQNKRADTIMAIGKNLLYVNTSGVIQIDDYTLKPLYPGTFNSFGGFSQGKAIFSIGNKLGIARKNGLILLSAKYDNLYADHSYFVSNIRRSGKNSWVVLDSLGSAMHTKTYDHIFPFNGKIFPVMTRNFWGAIDGTGKEIIACAYDSIVQQLEDKIVVKFRGQYGIVNIKEEWIVTPRPYRIMLLTDERYVEITPRQTFLKSIDGNVIYFSENKIEFNSEHLIEYLPSGNIWEINLSGIIVNRQVLPEGSIEKIFKESEGLRAIQKNGQYGFVDSQGRLRIANRYDDVRSFCEGLAAIKIRGKWGFINHEDKIAVQPIYEEVTAFQNGLSMVRQKGLTGMIDKNGKQILPTRYESVKVLPHGNLLIKQANLFGLASSEGNVLINPKYNSLEDLNNDYVIVARDGKYGVITLKGISTIPLIYDFIGYDVFNDYFLALKKSTWTDIKF
jgi:hypothetical protein